MEMEQRESWKQLVHAAATSQKRAAANIVRYMADSSVDIQLQEVGEQQVQRILTLISKPRGGLTGDESEYIDGTLREVLRGHTFTKQTP